MDCNSPEGHRSALVTWLASALLPAIPVFRGGVVFGGNVFWQYFTLFLTVVATPSHVTGGSAEPEIYIDSSLQNQDHVEFKCFFFY